MTQPAWIPIIVGPRFHDFFPSRAQRKILVVFFGSLGFRYSS